MDHDQSSFLGAEIVFDHVPLLRSFFQEANDDHMVASESKVQQYFEKMPDPCSISNRRGEIDRQGAGAIVSTYPSNFS